MVQNSLLVEWFDVPTLKLVSWPILTVTSVCNTGETGDILCRDVPRYPLKMVVGLQKVAVCFQWTHKSIYLKFGFQMVWYSDDSVLKWFGIQIVGSLSFVLDQPFEKSLFMVQNVWCLNAPLNHVTLPFESQTLSSIQMNPVFSCSVFRWSL